MSSTDVQVAVTLLLLIPTAAHIRGRAPGVGPGFTGAVSLRAMSLVPWTPCPPTPAGGSETCAAQTLSAV